MESNLIGKTVSYSLKKQETLQGKVVDQIQMLNSNPKKKDEDEDGIKGDYSVITGYLIEDEQGMLHPIQYWRIIRVHKPLGRR
jgi:hypothetical protein